MDFSGNRLQLFAAVLSPPEWEEKHDSRCYVKIHLFHQLPGASNIFAYIKVSRLTWPVRQSLDELFRTLLS